MVKVKGEAEIRNMVKTHPLELRRIFTITAHIDHGKSTACDFLMRRAGLLSDTLAGERRLTDYDEEEQMRGITIFTSVVLLNYDFEGKSYLLEINDTPGHISFTGEVSRALRGSDGAVLLVDALEGIMTQTETNIRLAVGDEWCKPVLFINKVDRLIRELKLPPQEVIERFDLIIRDVNRFIKEVTPPQFKDKWTVNASAGTVVFGSAKDGWAFTIPMLKRKGFAAKVVIEKYQEAPYDLIWKYLNEIHIPIDLSDFLKKGLLDVIETPVRFVRKSSSDMNQPTYILADSTEDIMMDFDV